MFAWDSDYPFGDVGEAFESDKDLRLEMQKVLGKEKNQRERTPIRLVLGSRDARTGPTEAPQSGHSISECILSRW